MNKVDIVVLSNTKDVRYYNMLKRCLESIKMSSNIISNTIVVETNKKLRDKQETLSLPIDHFIVPDDEIFNYNRYQNYGLDYCESDYICFSNNDVVYEKDTLSTLVKYLSIFDSVSPWERTMSDRFFKTRGIYEGYATRQFVTGWCFMTKRSTLDKIGKFDERFSFWFADDDYSKMLQTNNLKHALIGDATVNHLVGQSHDLWPENERYNQTDGLGAVFEEKWNRK